MKVDFVSILNATCVHVCDCLWIGFVLNPYRFVTVKCVCCMCETI